MVAAMAGLLGIRGPLSKAIGLKGPRPWPLCHKPHPEPSLAKFQVFGFCRDRTDDGHATAAPCTESHEKNQP